MKRSFLAMHVVLATAAILLFAGSAFAAKYKVAVEKFSGPQAAKAEAAVKAALKKRDEVELVSVKARPQVVISGQTAKAKKLIELKLSVNTPDGDRQGGASWKIKNGQTKPLEASLWPTISKAVKKTAASSAPAEEEEAPVVATKKSKVIDVPRAEESADERPSRSETASRSEVADSSSRSSRVSSSDEDVRHSDSSEGEVSTTIHRREGKSEFGDLDADVGVHAFTRSFTYNQPLQGQLASYRLSSGPAVGVNLAWFAGQLAGDESPLRNVGVGLSGETAFGIGSAAQDGSRVGTSAYAFDVGAKYRIPFDQHRIVLGAGYGQRNFGIAETDDQVLSMVPDVAYKFISLRAGGRLQVTDQISVNLSGAYLHLLGTGELGSEKFFPRLSGGGVEASAFLGYEVMPKLEVRVGADMQRFFFSMHPEVGDTNVAGGALDQFFAGTARIAYRLD